LKPDLSVQIGGIRLKNPVLVASGTFGYAKEFEKFFDLKKLGGIVTKTLTIKPRVGNPPQRVYETPSGMLNAIGLQNVGAEAFVREKLPYMAGLGIPVIASVMGYSADEFRGVVEVLEKEKGIAGFELNLSCPNVSYENKRKAGAELPADRPARMFAHDRDLIREVVKVVRGATRKTLIAKLGPDVSDIGMMARAAEDAGADAISLINTFIAMAINVKTRRPYLKNKTGGLSGPCIRPIAVRMIWEVAEAVKIPVIGMGGIMNALDAVEFLIAGASAIQVGTATFVKPAVCPEIIRGIEDFMKKEKVRTLRKLIGSIEEP